MGGMSWQRMKRPWLRPRFSLRVFLAAFTAFAIGFPVWYRWPYQEIEQLPNSYRGRVSETRSTTWRRQWGGGRLKHGPERHLVTGVVVTETNYRNGVKHGPYTAYNFEFIGNRMAPTLNRSKRPTTFGHYVEGMKEGVWTYARSDNGNLATLTWHRDQLDNSRR
jgi:hypothetical protein